MGPKLLVGNPIERILTLTGFEEIRSSRIIRANGAKHVHPRPRARIGAAKPTN